jgi:hypothetical protein
MINSPTSFAKSFPILPTLSSKNLDWAGLVVQQHSQPEGFVPTSRYLEYVVTFHLPSQARVVRILEGHRDAGTPQPGALV